MPPRWDGDDNENVGREWLYGQCWNMRVVPMFVFDCSPPPSFPERTFSWMDKEPFSAYGRINRDTKDPLVSSSLADIVPRAMS